MRENSKGHIGWANDGLDEYYAVGNGVYRSTQFHVLDTDTGYAQGHYQYSRGLFDALVDAGHIKLDRPTPRN